MPPKLDPFLDLFLELSSRLTGFERVELVATGLLEQNYRFFVTQAVETSSPGNAAVFWKYLLGEGATAFTAKRVKEIMGDQKLCQIGRNIIRLWLLGSWLPDPNNAFSSFVASAEAYQEGLLWGYVGAHPAGAKQPGYGSWSLRPQV